MVAAVPTPTPLIDTLSSLTSFEKISLPDWVDENDYQAVIQFLQLYAGNPATFESYRRELERLLQWASLMANKSVLSLSREDIEAYIQFCMKPPKTWIGKKRVARYIERQGVRRPNPKWRPFVVKVSKRDFKQGKKPRVSRYQLSPNSLRALFAVLGSFYEHWVLEDRIDRNPVALIRQKSRYLQKQQQQPQIIRLSEAQWQACLEAAQAMATEHPETHERTRFIITAMYLLYLRISECVATDRWTPTMNHFYRDSTGQWWFKVLGKGNKLRTIAVSDAMLSALTHYRQHLGLTPLPSPNDTSPLIPKIKGRRPVKSTRHIRRMIQACFDRAVLALREQEQQDEANALETATVHWLRHTGISDDVNKRGRPILHVRDDAGHASIVTTEGYSDVELKDRHRSAKKKTISVEEERKED